MKKVFDRKVIAGSFIVIALIISFIAGSYVGRSEAEAAINVLNKDANGQTNVDFEPFWKAWSVLNEKYVNATSTTDQEKVWGAIKGLAASTGDPYTVFFPPEESKMFESDISGNFEGVGMEIGIRDGVLTVVAPLKGSPAERAGIRAGDKILKVDDVSTADLGVDKAVKLIRGAKGTDVVITIFREGDNDTKEITITRDVIDIPTIETEVKTANASGADNPNGTGLRSDGVFIIRLFSFTAQSPSLFKDALRKFIESGSSKLVVDLRGNPGGYLEAAADIASWFLPTGKTIVSEDFGKNGTGKVYRSKGYDVFNGRNLDLVVLVDGGSASASEILAGALQEHGVAKIVGTKTFGKGSVQELVKITPDTSLKVTVAKWLTPNGNSISEKGIQPDIEVKITPEDIEKKADPQLDKALETVKSM